MGLGPTSLTRGPALLPLGTPPSGAGTLPKARLEERWAGPSQREVSDHLGPTAQSGHWLEHGTEAPGRRGRGAAPGGGALGRPGLPGGGGLLRSQGWAGPVCADPLAGCRATSQRERMWWQALASVAWEQTCIFWWPAAESLAPLPSSGGLLAPAPGPRASGL